MSTTHHLRKINKEKVIKALYEYGECNKNQLAHYTSLSAGTCYNVLQELLKTGEVLRGDGFASTGGRKAKSYKLNENFYQILTISFHRESQEIYYILRIYNCVEQQIFEYISSKSVIDFDILCLDIQKATIQFPDISIIAISLPAVISKEGQIEEISLVKGLEKLSGVSVKKELELRFQKKVIIENDVNVAAIGYYSCHINCKNVGFIYQPVDDLAGLAFIVNGQLIKGTHGLIGEMPFLPILTQSQQYNYLKTLEGRIEMISKFVVMMMIMNDPKKIIIDCQGIDKKEKIEEQIKKFIPYQQFIPEIIFVDDMKTLIFKGLILMARETQTSNLVMTTQKVY